MAPVKTGDRSDLIYSRRAIYGLDRCSGRDRCGQSEQERRLRWVWDAKRYVLRCERNWVLESESSEEHWLVVAELGDVLEKVLIDFGKWFRRIGAARLYGRIDILREEVVEGRSRVRWLEEQVEPAGLILIGFFEVLGLRGMEKVVGKRDDFVMGALFYFEQCRDSSTGVICSVFGGSSYCASKGILK